MKRLFTVLLIVCALCVLVASPMWAAWKAPEGSFLKYRAATVGDLSKQISTDSTVRMRYARHFNVAPDELAGRFGNELQLISLKSPLRVTTWYIDKNGKSFKKNRVLPKGTMVFATKDGKPMLLWSCGNPLSANFSPVKTVKKPVVKTSPAIEVAQNPKPADPIVTKVEPMIETIAGAAVTAVPPVLTEAVAVEPVAAIPIINGPSLAALPPVISKGSSLGWLGALGGAALGGVALAGGGGGGGSTVVIPEPSSLIAIATGLSTLGIMRRRKWSLPRK